MIHVETAAPASDRWHRQSSHDTPPDALDDADERSARDVSVRVVADAATLDALLTSGVVYETAHGEMIDRDQRWAIGRAS